MRKARIRLSVALLAVAALGGCDDPLEPVDGTPVETEPTDYQLRPSFAITQRVAVVDLGTLGSGAIQVAQAINNLGQVAGTSANDAGELHAFFWSSSSGMVDLGTTGGSESRARDINDWGQVVGMSLDASGSPEVFRWSRSRGMEGLGQFGGVEASAFAINNRGEIAGQYTPTAFDPLDPGSYRGIHAFVWGPRSGFEEIPTLGSLYAGFAYGINDNGQVVGVSSLTDVPTDPFLGFLWDRAGGTRSLGTMGPDFTEHNAFAMNLFGEVAGAAFNATDSLFHPFVWDASTGFTDLKTQGFDAAASGLALDVNVFGHMSVLVLNADGTRTPSTWVPGVGRVELPTLGGRDGEVWGINDLGVIVGWSQNAAGDARPVMWKLEFSSEDRIQDVIDTMGDLIGTTGDPDVDKELGKAIDKAQKALDDLAKDPPDVDKAVNELRKVADRILEALKKGLDPDVALSLLEATTEAARDLAVAAIDAAQARGGDARRIADAQAHLADGDAERTAFDYEAAIKDYRDAVKDAEKA